MRSLLTGSIIWSYDYEVSQRTTAHSILSHISGVLPFHTHEGVITLTDWGLLIAGDASLQVPFSDLDQICLGFDKTFPRTLAKNFGLFWQPMRLQFREGHAQKTIYAIIDYYTFGTKNQLWFDTLKEMLSD